MYAIFGKYGAVFQIRLGEKDKDTRGTAFVVYEVRLVVVWQEKVHMPCCWLRVLLLLKDSFSHFFFYLKCPVARRKILSQDIYDAKKAVDHLSGFNVGGRYLTVLYFQPHKFERKALMEEKEKELQELRKRVQQRQQKGK